MSQIKTVTTMSGENEVVFDAFYSFVWFKNVGEGDVYVAPYSGFAAGDVDVSACPAGQMVRITARKEKVYILGASTLEIHAQNFSDCPFKVRAKGGGQSITVEPLSVSENGTYTAPTGSAYSPVTANVPNTYTASDEGKVVSSGALVSQTTRNITENGTYDTTTNNSVVVDVQEQPWEPLEDGYSNFWFELTDDTLSPWLNFSAKNADAVIDWGDGSGEVALDTLTPTHTYAKAGKYVVKVKGVTGIERQHSVPYGGQYLNALIGAELSTEINSVSNNAFIYCTGLKNIVFLNSDLNLNANNVTMYCGSLKSISYPAATTSISSQTQYMNYALESINIGNSVASIGAGAFGYCISLPTLTIPASVNSIGNSCFNTCASLSTIHIQATTPPTLSGSTVFSNLPSDWICYVPVGTGDTYKAAEGWSTYADHIVEEGQTLSKAALRRIQAAEKTIDESEVR